MTTSKELNLTDTEYKTEEWQPIPGYPNHAISDYGRIMRITPGPSTREGRILKGVKLQRGYHRIRLDGKLSFTHRLVMLAFVGECPLGMEVNHKNGIKNDNRLVNLEYVTPKENMSHAKTNGLLSFARGESIHCSKLTENDVREIRNLRGVMPYREIAQRFGVNKTTISDIFYGRSWVHVDCDGAPLSCGHTQRTSVK